MNHSKFISEQLTYSLFSEELIEPTKGPGPVAYSLSPVTGPKSYALPPLPGSVAERSQRKIERMSNDDYEYYGSGDFIDPFSEDPLNDMYSNYEDLGSKHKSCNRY